MNDFIDNYLEGQSKDDLRNIVAKQGAEIERLKQAVARIFKLDSLTADMGDMRSGRFISATAGSDPEDSDFSGLFMSGEPVTMADAHVARLAEVLAGIAQVWLADGALWAGLGDVKLDENGITITAPSLTAPSRNIIKFVYGANTPFTITGTYDASTDTASGFITARGNANERIGYLRFLANAYNDVDYAEIVIRSGATAGSSTIEMTASSFTLFGPVDLEAVTVESLGVGGAAESGYPFKVTGNSKITGFLNLAAGGALTIAAGVVTAISSYHSIETEGGGATDDLDTINGGEIGDILIVRAADTDHTVVLKDGTGNLTLAGDFSLTNTVNRILLQRVSAGWTEMSRSANAA